MLTVILSSSSRGWTGVRCLKGGDSGCTAALTDGPYRAFTGQTDRQTIQSTSYRHCLSPSSMDSSPCPALMHHGGFNALHAKNTVKKGGEQKNNLFGTLENGKNELNWTENTTLWHSHTKNKLLLKVIFRQFPLTFYLKVTWTRLIVPFSTF